MDLVILVRVMIKAWVNMNVLVILMVVMMDLVKAVMKILVVFWRCRWW